MFLPGQIFFVEKIFFGGTVEMFISVKFIFCRKDFSVENTSLSNKVEIFFWPNLVECFSFIDQA